MKNERKYVVTGAAGFIGANLAVRLGRMGCDVICCDWLALRFSRNLPHEIGQFTWIEPHEIYKWLCDNLSSGDVVIHLGAVSDTLEVDVEKLIRQNLLSTLEIWDAACRTGCRLLYASSAATYGNGCEGFGDDVGIEKLFSYLPLNHYGWSKHVADCLIFRSAADGRSPTGGWGGFKFFNVYGPWESHKGNMQSVVAKMISSILSDEPVKLFRSHREGVGHGGQMRDFIYIDDVCDVLIRASASDRLEGLYNVGTGVARSYLDLATCVYRALNVEPRIDFVNMPSNIRDQYQYFTEAEVGKLNRDGLAGGCHSLEEGVLYYADWLIGSK